ncbi:organic solute transporter subunit alpha-like [Apostichopus japonicus]|uniref:organic solute transporter subunit alpha-like n=1 Tax=Stichopus japonicus TaxID=307972 RepID=UPI003AB15BB6
MTSMLLEGTETPLPLATINWVFNVSDPDCPTTDPSSAEVWQDVQENVALKVGFAILTAGTIILFVSFLEACVFIARKIPHGEEATSLVWIIGIYPVFAVTSLLGIYFPRAIVLCNLTASLYFSVSLYQAWLLFMFYFGDEAMAYAYMSGMEIRLLRCFKNPTITITKKNFRRLKAGILQVATLQPVVLFIEDILWLNGTYNSSKITWDDAFLYLNSVGLLSSAVALVALTITLKASKSHLQSQFYVTQKYLIIILALIFANMQITLLHILTFANVIPCRPPFKTEQRANRYQSLILLIESFLVYPLALLYIRTRKGNIVGILDTRESIFQYDVTSNGYVKSKKKPPKRVTDQRTLHFNTYTSI